MAVQDYSMLTYGKTQTPLAIIMSRAERIGLRATYSRPMTSDFLEAAEDRFPGII